MLYDYFIIVCDEVADSAWQRRKVMRVISGVARYASEELTAPTPMFT